ncbi:MAG: hypothetical protein K2Q20_01900, partial [Phycisphaerales bacterium]|nr:hypothetical protein [Phycisphaerales bacterium]
MVTFFNPIFLVLLAIVAAVVGLAVLVVALSYGVLARQTVRVMRDQSLGVGVEWPRDRATVVVGMVSGAILVLGAWVWMWIRDEVLMAAGFPLVGMVIGACLLARRLRVPARVGMIVCCAAMMGPLWFPVLVDWVVRVAGGSGRLIGWDVAAAVLAGVVAVVLLPLLWLGTRSVA